MKTIYIQILRRTLATALLAGSMAFMPKAQAQPVKNWPDVKVTSLAVNSDADDFAPVLIRGEEKLYFTSSSSGEQRLWSSKRAASGWEEPQPVAESLERARQLGSATFTPDGNTMIFAAYKWDEADETQVSRGRTDLFIAERKGGQWTEVHNLGPVVNSQYWDSQPTLSSDGRTLYFSSDRPGGNGKTDIYVSHKTASGWSAPQNLGPFLNSAGDDLAPSLAPDGRILFFSSNGRGGLGGYDIFVAKIDATDGKATFVSIENAGTPVNSESDELFYRSVPNSKNSYFCSNRNGRGLDVLLAYPNPFPPEAMVLVSGKVTDASNNNPIAADITITDITSGESVANFRADDQSGEYYVELTRGRRYSVTASRTGYIFYSDEYSVPPAAEAKNLRKDIPLTPVKGGKTRLLIFFDFDKSDLKSESRPELDRAIEFLKDNPDVRVELAGHTDAQGTPEYNRKLSTDRANATRSYLIDAGVAPPRLTARGYGETQPVADNNTDDGRAQNRRVEFRVQ